MRRQLAITIVIVAVIALTAMPTWVQGKMMMGENLEYKVISIDPGNWVVTANEVATGNVVKFRFPPASFKGQTFEADIETLPKGQRFSVRGPRNVQLNQLKLEQGLPGEPPEGKGSRRRLAAKRSMMPQPLSWEIQHVDPRNWIVTAKNRITHKVAKFQAHPEAFTGFLFQANLRGIKKGEGFSIVTPNNQPMNNCCTLLELQ